MAEAVFSSEIPADGAGERIANQSTGNVTQRQTNAKEDTAKSKTSTTKIAGAKGREFQSANSSIELKAPKSAKPRPNISDVIIGPRTVKPTVAGYAPSTAPIRKWPAADRPSPRSRPANGSRIFPDSHETSMSKRKHDGTDQSRGRAKKLGVPHSVASKPRKRSDVKASVNLKKSTYENMTA